jgi:crotonobetainyl-CoA:carnitine CoA-transferase CaiB-like acyl-CoA transferase
VLDLTRVASVRQLADCGANVIKINALFEDAAGEQPGCPRAGLRFPEPSMQQARDDAQSQGLDVFRHLAEKVDVIVENFLPTWVQNSASTTRAFARSIRASVYGSISGLGEDGSYRERPGFDQIPQRRGRAFDHRRAGPRSFFSAPIESIRTRPC